MPVRESKAVWVGNFATGKGTMSVGSGLFEGPYSAPSRFESGAGTNPEELIGAAYAGCFSMALSAGLSQAGFKPDKIETSAKVHIEKGGEGFRITRVELDTTAAVPGIEEKKFLEFAEGAKAGCPVSNALTGTTVTLTAKLVSA